MIINGYGEVLYKIGGHRSGRQSELTNFFLNLGESAAEHAASQSELTNFSGAELWLAIGAPNHTSFEVFGVRGAQAGIARQGTVSIGEK